MSTVLRQINTEVLNFQRKLIQIVPGFTYNQYETIQKIIFYYNSRFQTGPIDDEGDRKYFYNINRNPCKTFTKGVDFDTKSIRPLTTGGGDPTKTWFLGLDLNYWMRDKQFGLVLNRIFYELPIFGSVVIKVVNGEPFFVDLRNFIIDQSADDLSSANYKIEIHNYTPAQFRKIAKDMNWAQAKVDEVIEKFYKMKDTSHIRLYERYGDLGTDDGNGKITYGYKRAFIADVGVDEFDTYTQMTVQRPGVELEVKDWDEDPYWEFHADKIPGRWLGVGVVETLFEPQTRQNEIANLQAKSSYWAAIRVFQSKGGTTKRNLLTDVNNGEILDVDSDITQIDMSDRNLAFFNEETGKWVQNANDLTVAYAPIGHSVIAIQVAQDQVVSYFEQIQENIALTVKEMLYEVILPQFEKDSTAEHTIRLVGKNLDEYIEMVKNDLVNKEVIRLAVGAIHGKPFPTSTDRDAIAIAVEQSIKQGKEYLLTIPKGFYEDAKYDIDIDITGESVDNRTRYATKFAILQAITADPTALTDPTKRRIIQSMAEDGGINPTELFGITAQKSLAELTPQVSPLGPQAVSQMRAGGGVSAPADGVGGAKTAIGGRTV